MWAMISAQLLSALNQACCRAKVRAQLPADVTAWGWACACGTDWEQTILPPRAGPHPFFLSPPLCLLFTPLTVAKETQTLASFFFSFLFPFSFSRFYLFIWDREGAQAGQGEGAEGEKQALCSAGCEASEGIPIGDMWLIIFLLPHGIVSRKQVYLIVGNSSQKLANFTLLKLNDH